MIADWAGVGICSIDFRHEFRNRDLLRFLGQRYAAAPDCSAHDAKKAEQVATGVILYLHDFQDVPFCRALRDGPDQ